MWKVTKIINACRILHNICIFYYSNWENNSVLLWEPSPNNNNDDEDEDIERYNKEIAARETRCEIIRNLIIKNKNTSINIYKKEINIKYKNKIKKNILIHCESVCKRYKKM